jgi:hypothetical protein
VQAPPSIGFLPGGQSVNVHLSSGRKFSGQPSTPAAAPAQSHFVGLFVFAQLLKSPAQVTKVDTGAL